MNAMNNVTIIFLFTDDDDNKEQEDNPKRGEDRSGRRGQDW